MKHAERASEDGADRAGKIVCIWTIVGDKPNETEREKEKERVRS